MNYPNTLLATFLVRDNRFIARCLVDGQEVIVHVKNTGRGKELLHKGALVTLQYWDNSKRKTNYDLISVKKEDQWINLDSQVPNRLGYEGLLDGTIQLPNIKGKIALLRREVVYGMSKFDLYFETDEQEKGFIEIKGMTLENKQIGAFPDALTIRGLKHVNELIHAKEAGYYAAVLFMIQFEVVQSATIHRQMQPDLSDKIAEAQSKGVEVFAYNCQVNQGMIAVKEPIPFDLNVEFDDPNL